MNDHDITDGDIAGLYGVLTKEAEAAGYYLNPDTDYIRGLIKSLIINDNRYGYRACPCRLASGNKEDDIDIICPCDYRDSDLADYGACYCALYVSEAVLKGTKQVASIPERRPPLGDRKREAEQSNGTPLEISVPVWRCRVCGYLCAREQPPELCPICKAQGESFKAFLKPMV